MPIRRYRLIVLLAAISAALVVPPAVASATDFDERIVSDDTVLTEDHHGWIRIWGEGATLDCAGYAVIGDGSHHGIYVSADNVTVRNCDISGAVSGVFTIIGVHNLRLEHNMSHGNSGNGYGLFFATDVTAVHNHGYSNGESGIKVRSTDDSAFEFNKLYDNGAFGIYLAGDSVSNSLYKNKVTGNDTGIFADPAATDNLVIANKAHGNASWGIEDETDGVLNTYADNTCRFDGLGTSSPLGLCDR